MCPPSSARGLPKAGNISSPSLPGASVEKAHHANSCRLRGGRCDLQRKGRGLGAGSWEKGGVLLWAEAGTATHAQKCALRWRSRIDGCAATVSKRRPKGAPEERLSPLPHASPWRQFPTFIPLSVLPGSCPFYFLENCSPVLPKVFTPSQYPSSIQVSHAHLEMSLSRYLARRVGGGVIPPNNSQGTHIFQSLHEAHTPKSPAI
jgi:hypothetical protein